jgi:hypothetical protein
LPWPDDRTDDFAYANTNATFVPASAYTSTDASTNAREMFQLLCTARGHRDSVGFQVFRGRNVDKR